MTTDTAPMTAAQTTEPTTLPPMTRAERAAAGKTLRATTPRSSHAGWSPSADRDDPLALLEGQNRARVQDLVPIRFGRMMASPFAFLRGSARSWLADLARRRRRHHGPGLRRRPPLELRRLRHPERQLVFDINDFDETCPAPGSGTSSASRPASSLPPAFIGASESRPRDAARSAGALLSRADGRVRRAGQPRALVRRPRLETITAASCHRSTTGAGREAHHRQSAWPDQPPGHGQDDRARRRRLPDHREPAAHRSPPRDGRRRQPPGARSRDGSRPTARRWSATAGPARQYRFVDAVRKVVGVGSVGTRCYRAPARPRTSATRSSCRSRRPNLGAGDGGASGTRNHGKRVVEGQRLLQPAQDIFLGWGRLNGARRRPSTSTCASYAT